MSESTEEERQYGRTEMSFLGHLEELRSRAFKAILWVLAGAAVAAYFRDWIMTTALLGPAVNAGINLQNLEPFGQAFLLFKVIFFAGLILASPLVIWQIWAFVAPGLHEHEKRWARWVTLLTTLCFLLGIAFGYFLLIPSMMNYINVVANPNIQDNISTTAYFSFFVNMLLASGLIFELPMVTWVLSKVGIVSPDLMVKYRRHSIVAILIVAAVITPTPDPVTQLMVAIPLYILYEISVLISRSTFKKRL